jgi:hypothetical protein
MKGACWQEESVESQLYLFIFLTSFPFFSLLECVTVCVFVLLLFGQLAFLGERTEKGMLYIHRKNFERGNMWTVGGRKDDV